MKNYKLLALLFAVSVVVSLFAGCKEENREGSQESGSTETSVQNVDNTESNGVEEDTEEDTPPSYDVDMGEPYTAFPEELTAQKVGTIDVDSVYHYATNGIIYRDDNGKYGIVTLDGKNDTGAKYVSCDSVGDYFKVTFTENDDVADIEGINRFGVVDVMGNELIPTQYATVDKLNERYFRVCEVTEQTEDKDEALIYLTTNIFQIPGNAGEDDTLFKGVWRIYDITTGKTVEEATGTNNYEVSAYGNFVKYITDSNEQVTVNDKGEALPESANLFENGCYSLVEGNVGAVYDSDHNKLFDYDINGFVPYTYDEGYIIARKSDDSTKYVCMDMSGNIVSPEFDSVIYVYGEIIESDNRIYNFNGDSVAEGQYSYVYLDDYTNNAYFAKSKENADEYTLIKKDGTVLYQGVEDDVINIDTYNFTCFKTQDEKQLCYSLKDEDYVIEGNGFAPWLVKTADANYTYNIVDTISGNTIISGYESYNYVEIPGSMIYVYAKNANSEIDIYTVR